MDFSYKTDVAWRELGGERVKNKALLFASELIGCVNLNIAVSTESSLIGTTYQCSWIFLTYITLYLRHSLFHFTKLPKKRKIKGKNKAFLFWFLEKKYTFFYIFDNLQC